MGYYYCLVKPEIKVPVESLLSQSNIRNITAILQTSRLRWLGHVESSAGWISQVCTLEITGYQTPYMERKTSVSTRQPGLTLTIGITKGLDDDDVK